MTTAIESVRAELSALSARAESHDLVFDVGPVELEFTVEVVLTGETGTAVKLWVVEAGAKGTIADHHLQTVRVTLEPRHRTTGRRVAIGDEDELGPRPAAP
ncbi:trypco2 family protein [Streptomyces sp. NBC_00124]|uniref:trypco2 family protein n=1 Tax=Streptomyces sp. NBC_00124 TaxID=2975662 RepID=UPI002255CCC2|nr:trypco2 family protein [Streptomyces sp. NBC_00124]